MAFVNEYIPEADIEKYGIKEINKKFVVGGTNARDWTVDRVRDMYLRNVANGREEFRHQSTWTFYWHGELMRVDLDIVEAGGKRGEACWSHKKIRGIQIPQHLEDRRSEILSDLKEALTAYKDGGVFATATTYTLTLDI